MDIVRLDRIEFSELGPMLQPLIAESIAEGFRLLERLSVDFESGVNRFQEPSEGLFGVLVDGRLVAVGGLNIDPYRGDPFAGRVRRVYVSAPFRRRGIGRELLNQILETARKGRFKEITLRTDTDRAAMFYDSLGFERVEGLSHTTHRMTFNHC